MSLQNLYNQLETDILSKPEEWEEWREKIDQAESTLKKNEATAIRMKSALNERKETLSKMITQHRTKMSVL